MVTRDQAPAQFVHDSVGNRQAQTKPVGDGLGLGLAVSYAIVHEIGGRLTACNHADGAQFTLTLPIAQES